MFALFENEQESFSRLLVVDITTDGPDIATRLQGFEVKNAHCYGPNSEHKIRQAIEAGPGGVEAFNRIMRKLGDRLAEQKELAHEDESEGLRGSLRRAKTSFLSPLDDEKYNQELREWESFLSTLDEEEDEDGEDDGTSNPVYGDRHSSVVDI